MNECLLATEISQKDFVSGFVLLLTENAQNAASVSISVVNVFDSASVSAHCDIRL